MALSDVRKKVIVASRRFDLLDSGDLSANVDNGANYYINQGQSWLDEHLDLPEQFSRYPFTLAAGAFMQSVIGLLEPASLIIKSAEGIINLRDNQYAYEDFRTAAGSLITNWPSGIPSFWCLGASRLAPARQESTVAALTNTGVLDLDDMLNDSAYAYDTILVYPKADKLYTLELIGKFSQNTLEEDADNTLWTKARFEDLLVNAACYKIAEAESNYEKMKMRLASLEREIDKIDDTLVARESVLAEAMRKDGRHASL